MQIYGYLQKALPLPSSHWIMAQWWTIAKNRILQVSWSAIIQQPILVTPCHICMCQKSRQILGLLYRRFYSCTSPDALKQLYLSLVRPHLEYACQIWDSHLIKDKKNLEGVQKFGLKLASHQWDCSCEDLLATSYTGTETTSTKIRALFKIVSFPKCSGALW